LREFQQQVRREEVVVLQLEDVLFDPIIEDDVVPPLGLVVLETVVVVYQWEEEQSEDQAPEVVNLEEGDLSNDVSQGLVHAVPMNQ
jgi:hypothetical protein